MSEMLAVKAKGVDTPLDRARKRFVAHYVHIGAILFVVVTAIWLVAVFGTWVLSNPNYFAMSAIAAGLAYVLALGYFAALIVATYQRTGLLWAIIIPGTRFNLLLFPLILTVAVGFEVAFDLTGFVRSFITIFAVYFSAYGVNWLLGKLLTPRDEVEAAAYGDRWLKLADVTIRDILLFRIPHERA